MTITFNRPDGLYLSTQATLRQLLEDEALRPFADGLLHAALVTTFNVQPSTFNAMTLTEALHDAGGPETYPLLTALLALDAEVHTQIGDERRVLPLPAFLSYRLSLPPDKVPLESVRLPPLNRGGRYTFAVSGDGAWLAVRLDLHERLRVTGHVRLALSSPARSPLRLRAVEDRLERQVMAGDLIEAAVAGGDEDLTAPLTTMERAALVDALQRGLR
ncbi:MAG: hypothetical protein HS126_07105 [Anaerolineales bacterium]|nr:hypothetical protein [Anaerolineales bacterium]